MSCPEDKIQAIDKMNIVPVAVSYEWEPCDILKALELLESRNIKYIKKPGEDLNSILTGILQFKGRVHFEFCPQIKKEELAIFNNFTNNDYHKKIAQLIDDRIINAYKLWPNNYIAYDIQYGQKRFTDKYSEEEKEAFTKHLAKLEQYEDQLDELKEILLSIYSNPVKNAIDHGKIS